MEGLLVKTVLGDAAEQEQRFEGSVSVARARGSHAPDSTSPEEIEGTVTPLGEEVYWRHGLSGNAGLAKSVWFCCVDVCRGMVVMMHASGMVFSLE